MCTNSEKVLNTVNPMIDNLLFHLEDLDRLELRVAALFMHELLGELRRLVRETEAA